MSQTPVTLIAAFTIRDVETYRVYEKGFFPLLKKHGGSFITFDDAPITLEGTAPGKRVVLFSFPSEAAARRWYEDPEYQQLSEHRRAATEASFLAMVHGSQLRDSHRLDHAVVDVPASA